MRLSTVLAKFLLPWLFGRFESAFGRLCVDVPPALCSSRAVCQVAHVVPEPAMLSVGVTATSQSARLLRIILQSLCIRVPWMWTRKRVIFVDCEITGVNTLCTAHCYAICCLFAENKHRHGNQFLTHSGRKSAGCRMLSCSGKSTCMTEWNVIDTSEYPRVWYLLNLCNDLDNG